MQDLKIAAIQPQLVWEDKEANKKNFTKLLQQVDTDSHLIVLPEMFTTGFSMQPEKFAETMDGPAMQWLAEQAKNLAKVITGSIIIKENGNYYNRLIWMRPDGSYETYDKRHLFTMAAEQEHYSPGTKKLITELNGWQICPMVCYDLRFPVWARNTQNYDVLIFVANWPERRSTHWKTLLPARAIENQCFVVGLNRVGDDGNKVSHSGDSGIFDPLGRPLITASHQQCVIHATLSYQDMLTTRRYMPFLNDRDKFELK